MSASLVTGVIERDPRAIARALSAVSGDRPGADALRDGLRGRTGRALLVGVTGPPGAGKSTLVDRLIANLRASGRTVGVLAVDPTSPVTGGAILGDRVRMQSHASDPGVFIRSLATRGQVGGLSAATAGAADVLDAAGFDVVLIETVGVGQDEVDVAALADVRVVVFMPDAGDDVQDMKAGIVEIGDVFVINKADRPGADRAVASLESALRLGAMDDAWVPPVCATVATDGTGVAAVTEAIDRFRRERGDVIAARRRTRESRPAARPVRAGGPRIDHVGVAVSDPAPLVDFLSQAFGASPGDVVDLPDHGVRVRFVQIGEGAIEVVEARDSSSPLVGFLTRRGPGLHHLAVEVPDIAAAVSSLRAGGVRLIDETPRPGAGGRLVAFVHPASAGGVLVELVSRESS